MFRLRPKYNCVYDSLLFTALRVISPWHQVVGAKAEHYLLLNYMFVLVNSSDISAQILTVWFSAVILNIAHFDDIHTPAVRFFLQIPNVLPFTQIVTAFTGWYPEVYFSFSCKILYYQHTVSVAV